MIDDVLRDFESTWKADKDSLHDFLKNSDLVASSELQLRLLERELRLRLLAGQIPCSVDYQKQFPHFASSIDNAISEQVAFIANSAFPVETKIGELPQRIDGYEVLHCSGRDGISVCYDAIQLSLSRTVRLRALLFPTESMVSKARAVAKLEHPNFENTIDVFQANSTWFVVSQLESGSSISAILSGRSEAISSRSSVRWIRTIADALLEMHRRDIAHYNVSPSKIFVRFGGEAVLLNPNFESPLPSGLNEEAAATMCQNMPFPYRSIVHNRTASRDSATDDTVALGLVFFQLLTNLHLENFYLSDPLPSEPVRLKKLIGAQLDYADAIDDDLKRLCERSTLGLMNGDNPCRLVELRDGLLDWEQRHDKRLSRGNEVAVDRHSNGLGGNSTMRGFPWF